MNQVVKDNALINASYSLELVEQRIVLQAIIKARETEKGFDTKHRFLFMQASMKNSTTSLKMQHIKH